MKKKPFKVLQWAFLLLAIVVTCSGCFWGGPGYYGRRGYYGGGGYYHGGGGYYGGGRGYYGRYGSWGAEPSPPCSCHGAS
jgi:hypothetical protein